MCNAFLLPPGNFRRMMEKKGRGGESMLFGRKKKSERRDFDREKLEPVIRCSICTGEEVAGFRNRETGRFTEVMLLRSDDDLRQFQAMYDIDEVRKIY